MLLLISCLDVSDSLWPHGLQQARLPCPSPSPGLSSNSCPSSQWCRPTISSSVIPFSCLQSFIASRSFLMSWLFTSVSQSIGAWVSASVLLMNIDWFDHLAVQGTLKAHLQHHNLKAYRIFPRVCEYKQYPSSSNVQSAREIRQAQKWWYYRVDCALGEWFSKRGPQTSSMSITWELRNPHSHPVLNILNQKPWWWGPAIQVLIRHPGF